MLPEAPRDDAYNSYRPKPKWTVMIYLAGDNNLSANSLAIMQELESVNIPPSVRVLACFDSNTPRPRGARYLEIQHHRHKVRTGFDWGLHNDLVPPEERGDHAVVAPDFCNPDPSSVHLPAEPVAREGLSRFISWALRNHAAERYMLILFGHGTAVAGNTFLTDDNPPSFLRLDDFADVLKLYFGDGRPKLDILACHNCIMNGVESAYQIRRQVDFMLGSQGLVLAAGWPYRAIIKAVVRKPDSRPKAVALRVLRACARSLLDFSLMDRSSEQAVCDLRQLEEQRPLIRALRKLAVALRKGLATDPVTGEVRFKEIRDAVQLSRLEAQSYWSETFVDIYDFCELLQDRVQRPLPVFAEMEVLFENLNLKSAAAVDSAAQSKTINDHPVAAVKEFFYKNTPLGKALWRIFLACEAVLQAFRSRRVVPYSYYVGPELQYSHGLSVYFPWTLPEAPVIFQPTFPQSNDFLLKTGFDEYQSYDFPRATDWDEMLRQYFRATLRNVRHVELRYEIPKTTDKDYDETKFRLTVPRAIPEKFAPPVNLQKSSSDVDSEEDCTCPTIKNYPRRFYLSPVDCRHRDDTGAEFSAEATVDDSKYRVSYLGWNVRGIVAEEIGLPQPDGLETGDGEDDTDPDPGEESEEFEDDYSSEDDARR